MVWRHIIVICWVLGGRGEEESDGGLHHGEAGRAGEEGRGGEG